MDCQVQNLLVSFHLEAMTRMVPDGTTMSSIDRFIGTSWYHYVYLSKLDVVPSEIHRFISVVPLCIDMVFFYFYLM